MNAFNKSPFNIGDISADAEQRYKDLKEIEKKYSKEASAYYFKLRKDVEERIANERERYEEDLEYTIQKLRMQGIEIGIEQEMKLRAEANKKLLDENHKREVEYIYKQSKQYKKTSEYKQQQQQKQKEIANLRSSVDQETGQEKGSVRQFLDNIKADLKSGTIDRGEETNKKLDELNKTMKSLGNAINGAMSTYVSYQTGINARLQSTGKTFTSIEKNLGKVAFSPLLKADSLYANLAELVQEGIVSNVEQRAFLMTIKDNIATTFDANSASLKRIIRVQQRDSTASRLGMEAFLTRYMNEMVQNTEYLTTSFDNVQSALLEASSLMSMNSANSFEFQVQKWLGAMSGMGLSESATSSLAQAIGYLGSGNVESLLNSNIGNLVLMASNRTGLSIGEMLSQGLNADTTNALLSSIVEFVQDIWSGTKGNNVVLSQLSNTFGLTVSDVRSIANMLPDLKKDLLGTTMDTNAMYDELSSQFGQMASRMNLSTILENAYSNFMYQTGATIASNPASFALWKVADMIGNTTGGINIPSAFALGTGVDLNTTVDSLLKLGLVGMSTLKNIGNIASAVNSLGNGASLLDTMGINKNSTIISVGANLAKTSSGFTTSQSSYVVNQNDAGYQQGATMMMKEQQQSALQENENQNQNEVTLTTINTNMIEKLDSIITILGDTGIRIADSSIVGLSDAIKPS